MEQKLSGAETGPASSIPRILYQTWKTRELPDGMKKARETWLVQNPHFKHLLQDDEESRATVASFGSDTLRAYDLLTHGAFRADLWRYCVLHVTGGVYADIDSECLVSIDDYLRPTDEFVSSAPTPRADGSLAWLIFNAFIAVRPNHPFLADAIDRATRLTLRGETDGFFTTGPSGLGISINRALGREDKHPNVAGEYENGFRLLRKQGKKVYADDRLVFLAEYQGYKDELSELGIAHWRSKERKLNVVEKVRRRFSKN